MDQATIGPTAPPPPPLPDRRSGRALIVAIGAVAVLVAVAFGALAWFGMLPWRGPLDPRSNGRVLLQPRLSVGQAFGYNSLWVYNPSRVDATIDSVEPATALPGVRVVDAWFPAPRRTCGADAADHPLRTPGSCKVPAVGYVVRAGTPTGNGPRLIVVLRASRPGIYTSPGFVIGYHVGPMHFTSMYRTGFNLDVRGASPTSSTGP